MPQKLVAWVRNENRIKMSKWYS